MDPIVVAVTVVVACFVGGFISGLAHAGRHARSARALRRPDGSQEVTVVVQHGYHPDRIELAAGVPATLRFDRRENDPCTEVLVSELFPSEYHLAPNAETVIRFTPASAGTFAFTCGLGMFSGRIVVRVARRRLAAGGLLGLLAVLVLSACMAGPASTASAVPSAAGSRSIADLGERRSEAGAVTIVAAWASTEPPGLDVQMDTHSVDLDPFDLTSLARVRLDGGEWIAPTSFDAPKGGHHRSGTLAFASVAPSALGSARLIELRIVDVASAERLLRWERAR